MSDSANPLRFTSSHNYIDIFPLTIRIISSLFRTPSSHSCVPLNIEDSRKIWKHSLKQIKFFYAAATHSTLWISPRFPSQAFNPRLYELSILINNSLCNTTWESILNNSILTGIQFILISSKILNTRQHFLRKRGKGSIDTFLAIKNFACLTWNIDSFLRECEEFEILWCEV